MEGRTNINPWGASREDENGDPLLDDIICTSQLTLNIKLWGYDINCVGHEDTPIKKSQAMPWVGRFVTPRFGWVGILHGLQLPKTRHGMAFP
jgi:hypothetical protein